jgi:hypothetical protein
MDQKKSLNAAEVQKQLMKAQLMQVRNAQVANYAAKFLDTFITKEIQSNNITGEFLRHKIKESVKIAKDLIKEVEDE